jgi:hypothetical protein
MPSNESSDGILNFVTDSGQAFFGSGIRSYGAITILGKAQSSEYTAAQSEYVDDDVVIIGQLMDGSLLAVQKGLVLYINQMEPDYENDWQSCAVRTGLSLAAFAKHLEMSAEDLPPDFETARERFDDKQL